MVAVEKSVCKTLFTWGFVAMQERFAGMFLFPMLVSKCKKEEQKNGTWQTNKKI